MSRIESTNSVRQRDPRQRDKAHLGRVAKLPCIACLIRRGARVWPVHVAHIRCGFPEEEGWRPVGAAEKPHDWRTAPLCPRCHLWGVDGQHPAGDERAWWEALGVYPPYLCRALVDAFAAGQSGENVLRRFADQAIRTCARPGSGG